MWGRHGRDDVQLDIKCQGLTFEVLGKALNQAKEGRLHILGVMEEACPAPRKEMRRNVVRINQVKINPSFIGKLIGPQGRQVGGEGRRGGGKEGGTGGVSPPKKKHKNFLSYVEDEAFFHTHHVLYALPPSFPPSLPPSFTLDPRHY